MTRLVRRNQNGFGCTLEYDTIVKEVNNPYTLVVHGGAVNLTKHDFKRLEQYNPVIFGNLENRIRDGLRESCIEGEKILSGGGTAKDSVLATIRSLENNELFNAGKGSCQDRHGKYRMDASIMDGTTRNWGSVALVESVQHPIELANECLKRGGLFLAGKSTTSLAKKTHMKLVSNSYFASDYRTQLRNYLETNHINLAGGQSYLGTVGAVALDQLGNICAGTSTGGIPFKQSGRVGDSPMIGISTLAHSKYGGLSCTGIGERFVRETFAHDIHSQMEYLGRSLSDSMTHSLDKLPAQSGGVIGIDVEGNLSIQYNTVAMFRGIVRSGINPIIHIWDS